VTICRLCRVVLVCALAGSVLAVAPALARPPPRKQEVHDKAVNQDPTAPQGVVGKDLAVGLGLSAGSLLSGLSGKLYADDDFALQMCVGVFRSSGFGVGADATLEARPRWALLRNRLFWGGGVGVAGISYSAANDSATLLAVAAIVEVGWQLQEVPLEFVLEARPSWIFGDLLAGAQVVSGGGALRWYF